MEVGGLIAKLGRRTSDGRILTPDSVWKLPLPLLCGDNRHGPIHRNKVGTLHTITLTPIETPPPDHSHEAHYDGFYVFAAGRIYPEAFEEPRSHTDCLGRLGSWYPAIELVAHHVIAAATFSGPLVLTGTVGAVMVSSDPHDRAWPEVELTVV